MGTVERFDVYQLGVMMTKKQVSVDELKKNIWLFEGREVRMTGRVADKQYGRTKEYLFEIYYPNTQNDSIKKWVRLQDLWLVRSASENVYVPVDLIDAIKRVVAEDSGT